MKQKKYVRIILLGTILMGLTLMGVLPNEAQETDSKHGIPEGVFINLTTEFYRELEKPDKGERVYGTRQSDEYLRQIAVSTKFMVESNLRIINQQEKIVELLETLNKKRK